MGRKKEQAVVDVIINNEQARQKVKELSADFDALRKRKREALKAGDTAGATALDKELKVLQKEMNQYKKSVVDVDHVLRNLNKVPLNQLEAAQRNLRKNLKLLNQDSKEYKTTLEKLNRVQKQIDQTQKQMGASGKGFMGGINSMLPLGIMGIGYALKQLTVPFTQFQYMMAKVGAISSATSEQFKQLKDDAKALGASTEYTATQVAELQVNYARLGFTPDQILKITSATLDLATATGSDLAASADVAGSTLKAFNYDASQMPRVVDVMAASFNKSALQLDSFAESMKYVAPIAAKANVTLEQTSAMLGILADRGIRGSQAGTALKRILSEIELTGKTVSEALDDLNQKGLSLADAEDEVGRYAMTALTVLADNAPAIETLNAALEDSAGAAQRAAAIMRDNIKGDADEFTSKLEGLTIQLGDKLNPVIRGTIQLFTWLLTPLSVVALAFAAYFITLKTGIGIQRAYVLLKGKVNALKTVSIVLTNGETAANVKQMLALRSATAATQIYAAVKLLLAGSFRAAAVAAKMFFASIGPVGWLAIGIGALVGVMAAFSRETTKATNTSSQLALELSQEKSTYDTLKQVVLESAVGSKARAEAIRQINERYKDYLPNLLSEKMSNEEVAIALDYVNKKMEDNIKVRIRAQETERLSKERFDAEKEALDNLAEAYNSMGAKSAEQVALAQQQFADLIIQLRETGDQAKFVAGAAKVFGLSVEEMNAVILTSTNTAYGAYTTTTQKYAVLVKAVEKAFGKVTDAANKTNSAMSALNALMGTGALTNKYETMSLSGLNAALSTVNSKLALKTALTNDQRFAAEAEQKEIKKQIEIREQQIKVENSYSGVLKRLNNEKAELEAKLNGADGKNKAEIKRIQDLIAAKQNEIDQYSNKTSGNTGSKWSLSSDEAYLKAKAELRERQMKGDIASEEEYSRLLLVLEIKILEDRIALNKEKGIDLSKLKSELAEKEYQQRKTEKSRLQKLLDATLEGATEAERENAAYEKRLRDLELFGKQREEMTKEEQRAFDTQERLHMSKLSSIYVNELSKEITAQQKAIRRKATALKQAHNDEMATAKTFEQKKQLLEKWFSAEELRRIKTNKDADRILKAKYAAEDQAAMKEDLEQTLAIYQSVVKEVGETGFISEGVKATEEDIGKLLDIIAELEEKLAEYGYKSKTDETGETDTDKESEFDVLGMSSKKWQELFDNIQAGNFGLDETLQVVQAIGNAFGEVSKLMTAMEQRDLKAFTRSQDKRKKAIENRVKAGQMSEEQAASATQKIDEETDAKREELERKQAKREKMLAAFNVIVSTAVSIAKALELGPIVGPILAAVVGAMGAVQLATIMATPLPGAEVGGMLVERQQDGKHYRAGYDPNRRGAVSKPTVLVGENGTEYVVPAEGYENPTIRPVLDIMERARRSGTIREINLPAALAASGVIPGRASGGYVQTSGTGTASVSTPASSANAIDAELLRSTKAAVDKLNARLDSPILAQVAMAGDKGLARQLERYNKTVNASQL